MTQNIKTELEGYGIENMQSTRAYLLNAIGIKGASTFKDICMFLINCENIMFDSPAAHQNYLEHGGKIGNYWHSSEIKENLETLQECGLIEIAKGTNYTNFTYTLTPEGEKLYAYIETQTRNGELGICPKCGTDIFYIYMCILNTFKLRDDEPATLTSAKSVKIEATPQTNVNGRKYHKLTINYTCNHCNHKWTEEDLT